MRQAWRAESFINRRLAAGCGPRRPNLRDRINGPSECHHRRGQRLRVGPPHARDPRRHRRAPHPGPRVHAVAQGGLWIRVAVREGRGRRRRGGQALQCAHDGALGHRRHREHRGRRDRDCTGRTGCDLLHVAHRALRNGDEVRRGGLRGHLPRSRQLGPVRRRAHVLPSKRRRRVRSRARQVAGSRVCSIRCGGGVRHRQRGAGQLDGRRAGVQLRGSDLADRHRRRGARGHRRHRRHSSDRRGRGQARAGDDRALSRSGPPHHRHQHRRGAGGNRPHLHPRVHARRRGRRLCRGGGRRRHTLRRRARGLLERVGSRVGGYRPRGGADEQPGAPGNHRHARHLHRHNRGVLDDGPGDPHLGGVDDDRCRRGWADRCGAHRHGLRELDGGRGSTSSPSRSRSSRSRPFSAGLTTANGAGNTCSARGASWFTGHCGCLPRSRSRT